MRVSRKLISSKGLAKVKIHFNRPFIVGKELEYISQAVAGGHIAGDGDFTKKCSRLLEEKLAAKKIMLTTSCTSALEMAAMLCRVGPGDEVILPSFTFVTTANAFHLRGAHLVFVDIRPDTLNIDEEKIKEAITEKTKVIVPVHYAGFGCEMDSIMETARENNLLVVEDAAMGLSSTYKNKHLGTIGDIGAYSFHETKNFICGEGGAIAINNDEFIERAEIIREKGTNRAKFFRGEVDKYTWVDEGSSYLPSDLLAAFLYAQLEKMEEINKNRREIFDIYFDALSPMAGEHKFRVPIMTGDCDCYTHMFYLLLEDEKVRNSLMDHLKSKGILAVFHYLPLHLSGLGVSQGYDKYNLPITESVSSRILRLPFYYGLDRQDQATVINEIEGFFSNKRN